MNFKEFYMVEREDQDKLNIVEKWVEEIWPTILNKTKERVEYYFGNEPDKTKIKKKMESFLKFDTTILPVKFFRYSRNGYNGEYISTTGDEFKKVKPHVMLYNEVIADTLEELEKVAYSYNKVINLSRSYREYKEDEKKDVLKKYKQLVIYFDKVQESIKSTLTHELIHYYDDIHNKSSSRLKQDTNRLNKLITKDYSNIDKIVRQEYINRNEEYNAFYLTAISNLVKYIKKNPDTLNTFDDYKNIFLSFYRAYNELNSDNKKRVMKRFYDFYNKIVGSGE